MMALQMRSKLTEENKENLIKKFNDGMQSCCQATLGLRKNTAAEARLELKSVNVRSTIVLVVVFNYI